MNNQYKKLFTFINNNFKHARIGLLSNQVSFDFTEKKYLAQLLTENASLSSLFIPEHGFFAEQQDQVEVQLHQRYAFLPEHVKLVSLYDKGRKGFHSAEMLLDDHDLIIIDIQDIGSRYYTYVTTIAELLKTVCGSAGRPHIILVDHPNLAGRQVEGTRLHPDYTSLLGWEGIPHRYGLTIGELALFFKDHELNADIPIEVIRFDDFEINDKIRINPSPNIPQLNTLKVLTGQCLLEGTNVSEGRGTTRPFEIFGAPFFGDLPGSWLNDWNRYHPEAILRPLIFVPTFHKYKGQRCAGFQLHHVKEDFHSLWYSLKLIRELNRQLDRFRWREGPYESGSDKRAIEILAGDPLLIEYLNGDHNDEMIRKWLIEQEKSWIDISKDYLIYDQPLKRSDICRSE